MANFFEGQQITLLAAADLSAQQFRFVRMTATGINITTSAVGQVAIGVLQDKPSALNTPGSVMLDGGTKMVAGAAVAAGDNVTSDGTGRAIATTTVGNQVHGVCVEGAAAAGNIITVILHSTQL